MTDAQALRHQLRNAGYCPIPLYGKEPPIYGKNNKRKGLSGWEKLHDVTAEQIDLWTTMWPDATLTTPRPALATQRIGPVTWLMTPIAQNQTRTRGHARLTTRT